MLAESQNTQSGAPRARGYWSHLAPGPGGSHPVEILPLLYIDIM